MSVIEKLNPEESFWNQLEDIPETLLTNNFSLVTDTEEYYIMTVRKKGFTHVFKEQPHVGTVGYKREAYGTKSTFEMIDEKDAVTMFNALLD